MGRPKSEYGKPLVARVKGSSTELEELERFDDAAEVPMHLQDACQVRDRPISTDQTGVVG